MNNTAESFKDALVNGSQIISDCEKIFHIGRFTYMGKTITYDFTDGYISCSDGSKSYHKLSDKEYEAIVNGHIDYPSQYHNTKGSVPLPIDKTATFFPLVMRNLPHWVVWKLESASNGRNTKIPYSPLYDGKASSTNPDTWSTFEKAQEKLSAGEYNGLGFVFTEDIGLIFIDLDHVIENDIITDPIAIDVIHTIGKDTYIEKSQSGTGLHIFAYGKIPQSLKKEKIEIYYQGRYVAMTGNALSACEPSDKHSEILKVYEKYKTPEKTHSPKIAPSVSLNLSDDEIIRQASNSSNGRKFVKLINGDWSDYPSQSDADFALCSYLAFWCDRNPETIERIFTASGLYRDKWERQDYRYRTIQKACDGTTESISEYIERKKREESDFGKR